MQNLPADLRRKPLPEQADVAWGEHVLPNFRSTLERVQTGYQLLQAGDLKGLSYSWGPLNDAKGQVDFDNDWMTPEELQRYWDLLGDATLLATNIEATTDAAWNPGALSYDYLAVDRGALNAPEQWPRYQVVREPVLETGQPIQHSGLYIPDLPHSCAQFLNARTRTAAPRATVLTGHEDLHDPITGEKYAEQPEYAQMACKWVRVIRIADDGNMPVPQDAGHTTQRIAAGERCLCSGFYFTPARENSRRLFTQGDLMPDFGSQYGHTIWQWDERQDA